MSSCKINWDFDDFADMISEYPVSEVAGYYNCSEASVINRAKVLGLSVIKRKYTKQEDYNDWEWFRVRLNIFRTLGNVKLTPPERNPYIDKV